MASEPDVVAHYDRGDPVEWIRAQLRDGGYDLEAIGTEELAGVDEFHLGGRLATAALIESMDLDARSRVLDVGSGIGGPARTIAAATGCTVIGVDLTPRFVDAARELSDLAGLGDRTSFDVADATALSFEDGAFDAVTLIHVGMNIADKPALFRELTRVLAADG